MHKMHQKHQIHQIARKHFGQSTEYWHFGPQEFLRLSVKTVSPVSLLKESTESTNPRHQGPASGSVAAPWKKTTRFHNVFWHQKNVEKKTLLTPSKEKNTWCMENRRSLGLGSVRNSIVECAQLLDISPCQSFQTKRLSFDMYKLTCGSNETLSHCSSDFHVFTTWFRFYLLLFCTSAPSVQRKCSRIFSKRRRSTFKAAVFPSTVMAEWNCKTGRYCHVISHFETRFHSTLPVACGYLVVSCNVS